MEPTTGILIFFPITIALIYFLVNSIKKRKKKWLIITLSCALAWLLFIDYTAIVEFYRNLYYPFSEVKIENKKYYRNGTSLTGKTSYIKGADSIVLKILDGELKDKITYIKKNPDYYISEHHYAGLGGYTDYYISKNGKFDILTKTQLWYMLSKDKSQTLESLTSLFDKPIQIETEKNRKFYTFFVEEKSSDCTDSRDLIGRISFENPRYSEGLCQLNIKLLMESKEKIFTCIRNKTFKVNSYGEILSTLELRSDKTFVMFSKLFGGSTSMGTWEIFNGDDVGEASIVLYSDQNQVNAGNIAKEIYLTAYEDGCKLQVRGSKTIYE
jgi:hypothetical protein